MARATERQVIDVEELVRLAYGVHMVDRVTPAGILALRGPGLGASPTAMIGGMLALGATVDTSPAGAVFLGRAGQMQAVEDDFLDVHEAVLNLPQMWADLPGGSSAEFVVWDDAGLREDARRLGFDVDGTVDRDGRFTRVRLAPLRHDGAAPAGPVAYRNGVPLVAPPAVIEAPMRPLHRIETYAHVIANGRAGTRPDLSPLRVERWRPVYSGKRKAAGHALVWETPPADVALERATYAAWRFGLTLLAGLLRNRLDRFIVTGPCVAEAPWVGDNVVRTVREAGDSLTG